MRGGKVLFEDDFDGTTIDRSKWLLAYLPHWTTPDRDAARYEIADSVLCLVIADEQKPWLP